MLCSFSVVAMCHLSQMALCLEIANSTLFFSAYSSPCRAYITERVTSRANINYYVKVRTVLLDCCCISSNCNLCSLAALFMVMNMSVCVMPLLLNMIFQKQKLGLISCVGVLHQAQHPYYTSLCTMFSFCFCFLASAEGPMQ